MRRTITILFVGIILLFASCTQYRIIPYPIPDSLGTGNENTDLPHFTVDKENGLLFEDDFTTDTTIYYDPGLVDDKITDNRADNMVVENGVAKLYGGGADIRFDSDSSNDPVTGVAPGYSHSYTFDTTSNNYTLTVKGSIPASFNTETMQTDFFGLLVGLYSGETSLYAPSAGVRFWKMKDGSLIVSKNIQTYGDDYVAINPGDDFTMTVSVSADDENAYEQTSIEINGETHLFDLGKRTKDLNAELSMIYLTMYGPYDIVQEHDYAGKGDLYMELESVALTTAEKAKADSLANTTAGTFNDQFTADSVDFYDPTPYKDMYNNDVSKDLAYNMVVEDGVAKLYGGGQFIQFDNLSSTSSEYVPEYDLASASSYTVKFSGKLEGIDNSEISMGKFGFTVGVVFNEDNVSDNTAWGGIFFAPKENSNNLEASGFIYTADDDTPIEVSNDSAFDITVEISKNDDGNWQSVTTGTIGNQDINFINSSTSQTNPVAVFFSPWGPYETGWAGKGPLYATLESFSFSCK